MDLINILKHNNKTLFTTPGHSQGGNIPDRVKRLLGKKVFETDFSEIVGLDNIRHPEGILLEAQNKAAEIYKTKNSFYLFNGSTSGILALMLSTVKEGDKVIVARNTHISVVNALILSGAVPVWVNPEWDEQWGIAKGINAEEIRNAIAKNPEAKALWLTSPTYEGVTSDVEAISKICKKNGLLLIVDEAHGALFPFCAKLPQSAIYIGADACVQSLHKTALSLTQTAILHIAKGSELCADVVQQSLNIVNSTSPSYPLLASIDGCVKYLNTKKGKQSLNEYIAAVKGFRTNISKNPKITLYENDDFTKLLISVDGLSGLELSDRLYEKFDIENEYENDYAVLCLTGAGTSRKKLDKLHTALTKIAKKYARDDISTVLSSEALAESRNLNIHVKIPIEPEMVYTPREAYYKQSRTVSITQCIGEISKETIVPYPPGIPVLIAGERISQRHVPYLQDKKWIEVIQSSAKQKDF